MTETPNRVEAAPFFVHVLFCIFSGFFFRIFTIPAEADDCSSYSETRTSSFKVTTTHSARFSLVLVRCSRFASVSFAFPNRLLLGALFGACLVTANDFLAIDLCEKHHHHHQQKRWGFPGKTLPSCTPLAALYTDFS